MHDHPRPSVGTSTTADGRQLDSEALCRLVGAAYAGCRPCQQRHTRDVLDGPPELVTHLAGVTYLALRKAGVADQTRDNFRDRRLSLLIEAFDADDPVKAENAATAMPRGQRAEVLDDTLDLLTGLLTVLNPKGT